jgi:hypothetical protein
LGSLPPLCFLSRWELRSFCGIRGALILDNKGYHEGVALQKAGREPERLEDQFGPRKSHKIDI